MKPDKSKSADEPKGRGGRQKQETPKSRRKPSAWRSRSGWKKRRNSRNRSSLLRRTRTLRLHLTLRRRHPYRCIISCATVLNNMDKCSDGVKDIIPADGVILSTTVTSPRVSLSCPY